MSDSNHLSRSLNYMSHVDGLRAVSVLGVIFFHFGFPLKGGFVGVDIFFVISGYLITSIIFEQHKLGNFSFKSFYMRRIRRLMPAFLVTVSLTLMASFLLFNAENIRATSISALYALFSISNVYFFFEAGYWATASETKPLLHTWSLSVEEQFYIVWPLILIILLSIYKNSSRVFFIILVTAILSLSLTTYFTNINKDAAFYISPFRVFEFLIGAMISFIPKIHNFIASSQRLQHPLSLIGVSLILYSFVTFSGDNAFPGWLAIVPCIGGALLILTPTGIASALLLRNPVMVWIGKISYSLYLVHWPLIAFYKFEYNREPTLVSQFFLILSCILLSVILFYVVEMPFRRREVFGRNIGTKGFFAAVSPLFALLLILVGYSVFNNGRITSPTNDVEEMFSQTIQEVNEKRFTYLHQTCEKPHGGWRCGEEKADIHNVLVIGDSHAPDGYNIAKVLYPESNLMLFSRGGCPPFLDVSDVRHGYKGCAAFNEQLFYYIDSLQNTDVVLLSMLLDDDRISPLLDLIGHLRLKGFEVQVLGVGPRYRIEAINVGYKAETKEEAAALLSEWVYDEIFEINEKVRERVRLAGGDYLEKIYFYCNEKMCDAFTKDGKELVVYDRHHLSFTAASELGKFLVGGKPN